MKKKVMAKYQPLSYPTTISWSLSLEAVPDNRVFGGGWHYGKKWEQQYSNLVKFM